MPDTSAFKGFYLNFPQNRFFLTLIFLFVQALSILHCDIPLFWWQPGNGTTNFGDELSRVIVERVLQKNVAEAKIEAPKLLAIGSVIHFADTGDCIWGSGINGKHLDPRDYRFRKLDIRSVRGPLTRSFLQSMGHMAPKLYGDPALLMSVLFPEFQRSSKRDYIVIPHVSEEELYRDHEKAVLPSESWENVVRKIVESDFVISGSLHGIIVAESFGIPARLLYNNSSEPLYKYIDYYMGTGRAHFAYALSIEEALEMQGEAPAVFDANALLSSFPFDLFEPKGFIAP